MMKKYKEFSRIKQCDIRGFLLPIVRPLIDLNEALG
jgi:hypothetical protein